MRAFVTGGTGLLGANLIRRLVWEGWRVRTLVRSMDKAREVLKDASLDYVIGDLRDVDAFSHELRGCDAVFHTVALRGGDDETRRVNVKGTMHLLTNARRAGIRTVVRIGASALQGEGDEAVSRYAQHNPEMRIVTVVPGWMFGPNDVSGGAAGRLIADVLAGKTIHQDRAGASIVDARDVAEAMLRCLESGTAGERYVVGGRYYRSDELFAAVSGITGVPVRVRRSILSRLIRRVEAPRILNSEEAVVGLGIRFRPLAETLRDTVEWFQQTRNIASTMAA